MTASPAPAVTASPMRPRLSAMIADSPAVAARIPSSHRQFQKSSTGPERGTSRTAASMLDITLGSFARCGRPEAISQLRPAGSRESRPSPSRDCDRPSGHPMLLARAGKAVVRPR